MIFYKNDIILNLYAKIIECHSKEAKMKKRKLKKVTAMTCAFAVAAASGAVPVNASTTLANG